MDTTTHKTTNHDTIKHWAANRNGQPVRLVENDRNPGLGPVEIYLPDAQEPSENMEEITWNEFLDTFEDKKLVFLYKENEPDGSPSSYYRLINRES